jgi:predicted aldo/keto reductase-like oxidoreductase
MAAPAELVIRRNERAPMQYRRFGKTNLALSVITLGGMRFVHGWEKPRNVVPEAMLEECAASLERALELGINHVETAHGYSKSEHAYGQALKLLKTPRDRYFFMTKGGPRTGEEMKQQLAEQLEGLGLDRIDLYGWHGINTPEILRQVLAKGGPLEVLKDYQRQGVIGHVGFSTHGDYRTICEAISTGAFEFVNLHWYYFWQRNWGAIQLARAHDMGVFIISPNDKGGHLFNPPELLRRITAPSSLLQWHARFCLQSPLVHTLSFGMHRPEHFEEMRGLFPVNVPLGQEDARILDELDARLSLDPYARYLGYELYPDPSGINIPEVLRFRRMLKCYDMRAYGEYRYNMFQPGNDWFEGAFATEENVQKVDLSRVPPNVPLKELLLETHRELYKSERG